MSIGLLNYACVAFSESPLPQATALCLHHLLHPKPAILASCAMEDAFNDLQVYNLDCFPAWKQEVWRQISKDAKDHGAFATEDCEGNCLKPYVRAHHQLYRWLVSLGCFEPCKLALKR